MLEVSDLATYFRVSVSSEETAHGKPAPDVYLEAAKLLGVEPGLCVAIEDSHNGILAAVAADMAVVAIPNRAFRPATMRSRQARRSWTRWTTSPRRSSSRLRTDAELARRVLVKEDGRAESRVTAEAARPFRQMRTKSPAEAHREGSSAVQASVRLTTRRTMPLVTHAISRRLRSRRERLAPTGPGLRGHPAAPGTS